MLPFVRQWRPELVVWDPLMYAAPMVVHVVGAAHVRVMYAADQSARIDHQYRALGLPTDPLVDWMSPWLARHGAEFTDELRYGLATVDPQPACVRHDLAGVRYLPARFVPVNRPLPVPDWVVEPPARPRVCLTLGVSNRQVHGREEASVTDLVTGLSSLDVEVVATLSAAQLASTTDLPANVRAVDFMPMNEALASCSAIVHQGGGATVGNAVVNGVPQLIVPGTTWSERASALALVRRGNGLLLDLADLTAESVRAGVERLLTEPAFARAAREVQVEMAATPTLPDLVPDLEALAR